MSETEQFEQFMRNYQNMVFTTAVRLTANEAEAQDIAQEVFLKAFARWHELAASPTAGGWLKTVTTNMCLNHLSRYRNRWRFFSEMFNKDDGEEEQEMNFAAEGDFLDDLDSADTRALLEEALEKLPPSQRIPLVLFHFENLSYEEISAKMKVSLSKVKIDIFRGREALKKKLRFDGDDGPGAAPVSTTERFEKSSSALSKNARLAAHALPIA
ncbi:MAG TPA: sigma-70 family RNA polymerase sigma factor [Methylomirabilota bacterium]|nr:sigma-70 family RNA polymerase sigma factor [Methylomirabilota bacterium]